jgi:hypothetical protein
MLLLSKGADTGGVVTAAAYETLIRRLGMMCQMIHQFHLD